MNDVKRYHIKVGSKAVGNSMVGPVAIYYEHEDGAVVAYQDYLALQRRVAVMEKALNTIIYWNTGEGGEAGTYADIARQAIEGGEK